MNEQQAKALFFAQYFGQEVFNHEGWSLWPLEVRSDYLSHTKGFLELRTIDQLTDEEFLRIGKGINWGINEENAQAVLKWVKQDLFKGSNDSANSIFRLFGVITPFAYINDSNEVIALSPEQIIAKGWAVVKEVKP